MDPKEVFYDIQKGYRHPRPDKCPDHVYRLMQICWNKDPHQRPSFAQLHSMLSSLHDDNGMTGFMSILSGLTL